MLNLQGKIQKEAAEEDQGIVEASQEMEEEEEIHLDQEQIIGWSLKICHREPLGKI